MIKMNTPCSILLKSLLIISIFLANINLNAQIIIHSPETENVGNDLFGGRHSIFNDKIAISAQRAITPEGETGAVYVYKKVNEDWVLEQELNPTDLFGEGTYGFGIELLENTLFVTNLNGEATNGAVYEYKFDGTSWVLESKITSSDPYSIESFGYRIAVLDENRFITSSVKSGDVTDDNSTAFYFEKINGIWEEVQIINTSNNSSRGYNLAINETNLFLSDKGYENENGIAGIVYVFEKQNGNWVEIQQLIPEIGVESGWAFGMNLELHEDYLAVASLRTAGFIYKRNSSTGLFELEHTINSPVEDVNNFASSISLNENYLLMGSYTEDIAFLFEKEEDSWIYKYALEPDSLGNVGFSSWDVDIYQNKFIISSPHYGDENSNFIGGVYIYELENILSTKDLQYIETIIFPNPAQDYINMEVNSDKKMLEKEIYSLNGTIIDRIHGNDRKVDISTFNKGMYFIRILFEDGSYSVCSFTKK